MLDSGDLRSFLAANPAFGLTLSMAEWRLVFLPSKQQLAVLAGEMFRVYLDRGGRRGRVVPDFLIAANAQQLADRLLARDRGYYRDYFKQLNFWDPSA